MTWTANTDHLDLTQLKSQGKPRQDWRWWKRDLPFQLTDIWSIADVHRGGSPAVQAVLQCWPPKWAHIHNPIWKSVLLFLLPCHLPVPCCHQVWWMDLAVGWQHFCNSLLWFLVSLRVFKCEVAFVCFYPWSALIEKTVCQGKAFHTEISSHVFKFPEM